MIVFTRRTGRISIAVNPAHVSYVEPADDGEGTRLKLTTSTDGHLVVTDLFDSVVAKLGAHLGRSRS